jgi:hypothetical protein
VLHWPLEEASPNVTEYLQGKRVDLVINIPKNSQEEELTNDYIIRRQTVEFGIPLITNIQFAQRFVEALARKGLDGLEVKSWNEYGGRGLAHHRLGTESIPQAPLRGRRGADLAGDWSDREPGALLTGPARIHDGAESGRPAGGVSS